MAKMTIKGLDEFAAGLDHLASEGFEEVASAAVYAGAGQLVECVKNAIKALPTENGYMLPGDKRSVLKDGEKKDLLDHIGIARFDTTGGNVSTAVGFNGYSPHKTKKYPNGVPIQMIARAIQSGSSVRQKNPFMRRTVNSNRESIARTMEEAAQKKLEELSK